jgi:uncharacterized pyridoxal phosphate-containing UPF0001 family protein
MAELIRGLRAEMIAERLEDVRREIAETGRDPAEVEILAAVKYVPVEELRTLADAGLKLLGENRVKDLLVKQAARVDGFTWDFIGQLQSRKVKEIVGRVRLIHSVASESSLEQLRRHAGAETRVLIEVDVAGEAAKSGVPVAELDTFLERCPTDVVGLMTMPPLASDPEESRPYFAQLRRLAAHHGLRELSMGTSQDYLVAVQEGATILRLGSTLLWRKASV